MSNFAFAQKIWPQLAEHLMPAESYLTTDPTASAARSRVVAEQLIKYLYRVMDIRPPYVDDFNARIHHNAFQQRAGGMVVDKFNLIRKHGNAAAHGARVEQAKAHASLRDLHHLLIWAGYHHSPHPELVPLDATFDPQVAKRRAVVPAETVQQFLTKVKANEERAQRRLEESEQERAKLEATIQTLREELAAKQQQQVPDTRDYGEAQTRVDLIDPLLEEAGWTADTLTREFEITGMPNTAETGYVDYVLWAAGGKPLAVVEAKRSSRSLEVGKQQAKLYADALERRFGQRPVIFVTNGHDHQIWDDAGGYPPREIHGFYTRDELEYLIRRRGEARTLESIPVDAEIAGRHYQTEAIRAINEAFEERRRQALLVMATGTGKTRTVVALVDQLMKAGWVRKVLFLADRTALVKQATNAFKQHLPSSAPHNLLQSKDVSGARVVVSTYQTIMGQLDLLDPQGKRKFGPGHFDLIVIDEAHRSVYAKYGFIFDYFDGLLVGLTATPKDEIDHNTYRLFNLEDGVPTDSYSLEEAVGDGYLVPFRQVPVTTKFQDSGIRYKDLSETEREEWDLADWGEEGPPDAVGATDLGKYLFNEDTVDKVLKELMTQGIKVADGDRLGKTIIFAASQHHAEFIQERFDTNWPEHAGHFARVITHSVNYAQSLIEEFSDPEKAPHIAISVDMLDTGIDVPEVVNLVFFKKVHSKTKFWQMIGRGTRLCEDLLGPGRDKTEFLIFDFCRNLEFFMPDEGQDVPTREGSNQKSLTERLFELRLDLIRALDDTTPGAPLRHDAARLLKEFVDGMHRDNIIVRPHLRAVEKYSDEAAWQTIGKEEAEELSALGGLPSSVVDTDRKAKRFDLVIINGQLAILNQDGATLEKVRVTVQGIAEELLRHTNIPVVQQQAELLENISDDGWWVDVTVEMLETVRRRIRGLAALVEDSKSRARVYTDFEDELITTDEVAVQLGAPGVNVERFKAKTQAFLREHLDHLALQRLRRNRALTAQDLEELEALLVKSGSTEGELAWVNEQPGGLGLFIRSLVGLEREAAIEAFGRFLTNTNYSVDQVRFINLIVDELTSNGVMEAARLFESPYTDRGRVDVLFPTGDVHVIVNTINKVRDNALTTAG